MTDRARVRSIGTATGPHAIEQAQARAFARGFFADDFPQLERLLPAFDNAGIESRGLARAMPWYGTQHTFADKNEVYREAVTGMSLEAAERALDGTQTGAALPRERLRGIVFVSTTGISTPSIDSVLIQRLDLPRNVVRVPIWGLGCAGGAAGLARSAELARALGGPVLLIAAEACSATFVHGDRSKSNLIATALFGDGAAAVVVEPIEDSRSEPALELLASHSRLLDDSADVMGWHLGEEGLQVRFARSIPGIVREIVPDFLVEATAKIGASVSDLRHYVVHPGGAKVLAAYQEALALPPERLRLAWSVLRRCGNMSSATVLFVLEAVMREVPPSGEPGVLLSLGPGFCAEGVVIRW